MKPLNRPYTRPVSYTHLRAGSRPGSSLPYWMQMGNNYLRMARRNLDGYRLYEDMTQTDPAKKRLSDLFDAAQIFDPARPTPVEWSYQ